ncbi:MAG: ribosomal protein, partial [Actinomycetota bacterium]
LPASHVELKHVRDLQPYVGTIVDVHVIELDRARNKVVLSRRDVLRGEMRKVRSDALSRLSPGSIVNGVVSNLDFGPGPEPRDVTRRLTDIPFHFPGLVGGRAQVRNEFSHFGRGGREKRTYLSHDDAADAAALMTDDPSPSLAGSFRAYKCETCEGWHVGHTGTRVFVTVDGVDGLVPEQELSWRYFDHPSQVVHVGMEVTAKVLDLDVDRGRLVLSIKAAQPEPWGEFARTHDVGQLVYGRVTYLASFGAFVQIGDSVEGLVHLSEMSSYFVEAPEQVVTPGEEIWVKIIDIDPRRRHIALSIKQAAEGGELAPEYRDAFGDAHRAHDDGS